ncbi:hypothetical protein BH766_gp84 [Gordonia phage Demosthenes]|uniref:Uncharacterized protein n=1 Tax=Gordonia phage Demosthenes TaxID=1838067 RepID=A0A166Y6Z1_9CAUD|nr:hypothetical protein BH766_gp84 [Gordonia phage Demosthenes]ANA86053.1 hypothetical protein PBI_DEMOSTHENES_84 [Gordonia phage Demosthenes]
MTRPPQPFKPPGTGVGHEINKASERTSIWRATYLQLSANLSPVELDCMRVSVTALHASIGLTWKVDGALKYAMAERPLAFTVWSGQVEHIATEMFEKALRIMHNEEEE